MSETFLFFDLYGPFASWGDVAIGEARPTYARPSRSAVLGLVGAALGIDRSDADGQRALRNGYGFGVRVDAPGRLLLDYHTAQVPTGVKARGLPTRRDELRETNLNTTLSTRSYRTDALSTACLWSRENAQWELPEIAVALEYPVFPLYLGRRACPLALPLAPHIIKAETVAEAFHAHDERRRPCLSQVRDVLMSNEPRQLYLDVDGLASPENVRTTSRRDEPLHRDRWTFANRQELVIPFNS